MRRVDIERTEERRRSEAHRRRRIWPEELAYTAESGVGFCRLEAKSSREKKGGEGEVRGGFIGAMAWGGG
jgi:hypothetical protein